MGATRQEHRAQWAALTITLARDLIEIVYTIPGFDGLRAACKEAIILVPIAAGYPAVQNERKRPVGGDPLTVVFTR
jgi:hypothetical protein